MLIDAHCHAYEIEEDIPKFTNITIIAVSDDYESSLKTIKLSIKYNNIIPCVGIHPWELKNSRFEDIEKIRELAIGNNIRFLGEVGIDRRYYNEIYEKQLIIFNKFVKLASNENMCLNIHALDAWRDVIDILKRSDVPAAIIHWYNGPLNLLKDIKDLGYYITINPAVKIQPKHKNVLRNAPLEILLTESDSPYEYRGLRLTPIMVKGALEVIAEVKGLNINEAEEIITDNFKKMSNKIKLYI